MSQAAAASSSTYQPPPGRLGNLSQKEQGILEIFRTDLSSDPNFPWTPARHDDATLLRFLRARKFDLAKSKEMIHAAEKWRKDFGVDDIVKSFQFPEKEEVNKYYPQYYHKTDKEGRPIYIEVLGKLDFTKLYAVTTEDRLLKRLVLEYERFLTERLPATSEMVGHPVETSCTILDLNNVGLGNFYRVKNYVSQASAIGQNYYPECMGKFYIINAPYLFTTVWSVVKRWLDEVTVAKIQIMSNGHKEVLLKQIDAENLPSEFGGNCKCEGGCSLSDEGPWKHRHPASSSADAAPRDRKSVV